MPEASSLQSTDDTNQNNPSVRIPHLLLILDGWGHREERDANAIQLAETPHWDNLWQNRPHTLISGSGLDVGLPPGQMGNSEVGHMNLGAGRVVHQDFTRISQAIEDLSFFENPALKQAIGAANKHRGAVHIMGLVSPGGVHSHEEHIKAAITMAFAEQASAVYLHAFLDGRDVPPRSAADSLQQLDDHIKSQGKGGIASIVGRYYAMDRDKRWERVKLAYDALVNGIGEKSKNAEESIQKSYGNNITDEFIKPIIMVDENRNPKATIKDDDVVIFFNFRTDRGRQLTDVLSQKDNDKFLMKKRSLYFVTLTNYDKTFKNIKVIYNSDNIENTLGEVLETAKKQQIRIAETEKYPHVTFFFSGGREKEFIGEKRLLCPSPKVATYDLKPEMSAFEIRDAIMPELEKGDVDFVCLNFANGDMVGHTGVFEAAVKACETVDNCTKDVITSGLHNGYTTILIADHGNCETMMNPDGSPPTAHTTNPVPIILIDKEIKLIKDGVLGDIAPTVLELMGVEQPKEMTRKSLL